MNETSTIDAPRRTKVVRPGLLEVSLLMLAFCGWLVQIANMFGLAGRTGWLFPVVTDIPGLALSTLALALLGISPLAVRLALRRHNRQSDR
jgi:hypothetical protein